MAKKPTKAQKAKESSSGGGMRGALVWVIVPILMVVFYLDALLLFIAMVPTLVAWISDSAPPERRRHYAAKTVGPMNLVGALWPLVKMHTLGADWAAFLEIVRDPMTWIICLAASSVGWAIHLAMPPVVSSYFRISQDVRRQGLKQTQEKLLKEWGTEVKKFAPKEMPFEQTPLPAQGQEEDKEKEKDAPFEPDDELEQELEPRRQPEPAAQGRVRRVGGGQP